MQSGLVSVMMPAYNAEQYIAQAIESLLAQTYTTWELIIVNDGSTDRTAEIVSRFVDPRIRVIQQANRGEAAARNTALNHTRGEFIAFLDADDAYLTQHLELTVDYLRTHPGRDGVYTDGYYCDQDGNRLQTLSSRRRGPFEGRVFEPVVWGGDAFGPPICVVLRQAIIAQFDLRFDEMIVIGPDWDFFTQYSDLGTFGYVPKHTCLYRIHLDNLTAKTKLGERAMHLAHCRMKAIKMPGFQACSSQTRYWVFYDLLVNLLRRWPKLQSDVLQWPEFSALPAPLRAKIYRIMAGRFLIENGNNDCVRYWLGRSRELDSRDKTGALLSTIYDLSPNLCKQLLLVRSWGQQDPLKIAPFGDVKPMGPQRRSLSKTS